MGSTISFRICVIYGFIHFCTSLVHNIFIVYHVQVFVSSFRLSKWSFWLSEIIFLVWNSLNDSIFGWLIDQHFLKERLSGKDIIHRRAKIISLCGPLLALLFSLTWFPYWLPGFPGVRFLVVLCSYDTATTLLDLMKGALLAELTVTLSDRSRLGSSASIGQALSAIGLVAISWWFDSGTNAALLEGSFDGARSSGEVQPLSQEFQALALGIAIFSAVGTFFGGRWIAHFSSESFYYGHPMNPLPTQLKQLRFPIPKSSPERKETNRFRHMVSFILEILLRPNFFIFCLLQALQVFHCHFNSNFFPLFAKFLLGPGHERLFCTILGVSFVLPHANNVFLLRVSATYGIYGVIRGLLAVKVILGLLLYVAGPSNLLMMSFFLASNRIFTEGVCKLFSQVISDLVDEDYVLAARPLPISALIFGATSLLGRPGQSLAPIIGYALLSHLSAPDSDVSAGADLRSACFSLAWSLAVVVGILQLLVWSRYRLRGAYLARIKKARITMESGLTLATPTEPQTLPVYETVPAFRAPVIGI